MKRTNSTPVTPIPGISNVGDLKAILKDQAGLSTADVNTLMDVGSGVGIVAAMENNDNYDKKGTPQSNQGNLRSRLATALLTLVRTIMLPIAEKNAEEIEAAKAVEAEETKESNREAKIKAWIEGGRVGRRPNGYEDPCEAAIKAAYHEAVTETREQHELGPKGRIPVAIARDYHESLKKNFATKLRAINKDTKLYATIETIVADFIDELDEATLVSSEIAIAIKDAAKNADKTAREAIGASEKGRIASESVADYNKAAKEAFRDSLRDIKNTHGSLPDTMDNLMTQNLVLYVFEDETEAKNKDKGKDKKNTPKPNSGKKNGGKKAQNESEPVSGEVSGEVSDADAEADANAAVAAEVEDEAPTA